MRLQWAMRKRSTHTVEDIEFDRALVAIATTHDLSIGRLDGLQNQNSISDKDMDL